MVALADKPSIAKARAFEKVVNRRAHLRLRLIPGEIGSQPEAALELTDLCLRKRVRLTKFNRWYDPRIGRWVSEDPIGFAAADANLYRYVGNWPTNWLDSNGLQQAPGWSNPIVGPPTIVGVRRKDEIVISPNPGMSEIKKVDPGEVEVVWTRPVVWHYYDENGNLVDTTIESQEAVGPAPNSGLFYYYTGFTPTYGPPGGPQFGVGFYNMIPGDKARICKQSKPPTFPQPKPPNARPTPISKQPPSFSDLYWHYLLN